MSNKTLADFDDDPRWAIRDNISSKQKEIRDIKDGIQEIRDEIKEAEKEKDKDTVEELRKEVRLERTRLKAEQMNLKALQDELRVTEPPEIVEEESNDRNSIYNKEIAMPFNPRTGRPIQKKQRRKTRKDKAEKKLTFLGGASTLVKRDKATTDAHYFSSKANKASEMKRFGLREKQGLEGIINVGILAQLTSTALDSGDAYKKTASDAYELIADVSALRFGYEVFGAYNNKQAYSIADILDNKSKFISGLSSALKSAGIVKEILKIVEDTNAAADEFNRKYEGWIGTGEMHKQPRITKSNILMQLYGIRRDSKPRYMDTLLYAILKAMRKAFKPFEV